MSAGCGPDFAGLFDVNRRAAVSIAELLADGVPVHPSEAVAIVRRVCASVDERPPRVCHATEIVLLADGELFTGTRRLRRQPVTLLLAALLRSLLDRSPLGHRASPALSDVVARGLGLLGPAKFQSAAAFADALHQFEGPDPKADLRALFARWRAVCDLANDLPEATQTVQLVMLDATGSTRPSVVVRKPDRRRYERVVFRADTVKVALVANLSRPQTEDYGASADGDEPGHVRELAIASVLLLLMVPTGLWFGAALTHLVRPELTAVTAAKAPTTGAPAVTAAGPALTAAAPLDVIAGQPDLGAAGSDFTFRSELPSTVRPEPISLRDTPLVRSAPKRKAQTRSGPKTYNVQLSPDGKRVAFDSDRSGTRAVYVADRNGKNLRRVSGVGVAERPVWSPNSRRLAFMRAGRTGVWNLWTVELETGTLRQVSFDRSGRPSGASWFPNSKRIGYSHGTEFRIVDVKNGRTQRFAAPRRGRIGASAVSPDGRRVVFRAGANATWLLDLSNDGPEQMRRILTDPSARAFSWAPDGKQLAYFSRRRGDWIVIPQ
jgi:WD40-like Beta Propeller Repeat